MLTISILGVILHFIYGFIHKRQERPRYRKTILGNCYGDFGGGGAELNIPEFYEDPYYGSSQQSLSTFGTEALAGKLPSYYSAIGETQSPEYRAMLNLTNRNTAQAVNNALARQGIGRSGVGVGITSRAVADNTAKLNYSDYTRALQGKQNILSSALGSIGQVQSGALTFQGQKNQYNMQKAQAEYQAKAAEEAASGGMWSSLLSAGIGALGTVGGALIGGPAGAAIGGTLGSAVTGGVGGQTMQTSQFGEVWSPYLN